MATVADDKQTRQETQAMLHEFDTLATAQHKHAALTRLNYRPFSIFQTARGTWAFWTAN